MNPSVSIASELADLARAWHAAGRASNEWDDQYAMLVSSISYAVTSGDNQTLRQALALIEDADLKQEVEAIIRSVTELESYLAPRTGTRMVAELFAIPVKVFIDAPPGTMILGKPIGPDPLQDLAPPLQTLLGEGSRVLLLNGFYDRQDFLPDYPGMAWRVRQALMKLLGGQRAYRFMSPAARPMEVTQLRKTFLRFLVGVSLRDFSSRRPLHDRRFSPAELQQWKDATEEALFLAMQRMGNNMTATVARPDQLSFALTGNLVF